MPYSLEQNHGLVYVNNIHDTDFILYIVMLQNFLTLCGYWVIQFNFANYNKSAEKSKRKLQKNYV